MDTITLTEEQINQVLVYLSERPYKEVAGLIYMLKSEWEKQHQPKGDKEGQ